MRRGHRTKKIELFEKPLFSMIISLMLVGAAVGFVFGFGVFLQHQTYTGPEVTASIETTEEEKKTTEYLKVDKQFTPCYIMICEVPPLGLWANKIPGEMTATSQIMVSGQILYAKQRGSYKGQTYYKLSDGTYLNTDISYVEPLLSYTEVEGYLAITYISSSGVRLRKWADFEADNVVGAVYVGDKVQVKAKVQTEKGASAYITTNGMYITSDTQYYNDYTSVVKDGEKTTSEKRDSVEDETDKSNTRSRATEATTETKTSDGWDFSDRELNQQE